LGTGKGNSVLEIIKAVEEATGKKFPEFEQGPARQGEYATMVAATEKATQILKWKPTRSLADSAQSLVTWYTQHPHGWKE
jgi:UDP-glucose 4-epimerase